MEVDKLRQTWPGKLAYINLFPSYASSAQLGRTITTSMSAVLSTRSNTDVLSDGSLPDDDSRCATDAKGIAATWKSCEHIPPEKDTLLEFLQYHALWFALLTPPRASFAGRFIPRWRMAPGGSLFLLLHARRRRVSQRGRIITRTTGKPALL